MILFSGHPASLKKALAGHLAQVKSGPLDRVLLVLPSAVLSEKIKRDIAAEEGFVSALYTTGFFELAKNIYNAGSAEPKPVFADENLQNFILKNIQQKYGGNYSAAYIGALKSTLRDIVNAQIAPEDLLNYTQDSSISLTAQQKGHILELCKIYGQYLKDISSPEHINYGELLRQAADKAPQSAYLNNFKHIIFYGFYDLTGLQIDLFNIIRQSYEVSFFAPYEELPAYHFAKNFYELHLFPYAARHIKLAPPKTAMTDFCRGLFDSAAAVSKNKNIKIINTAGAYDEVEAAAKEILSLAEEQNIPFDKIALTARVLDNYKNDIFDVFEQNKIPLNTALPFSLEENSLGAFVLNLFSLDKNNFGRDDVLAVAASPYFRAKEESWTDIVSAAGITGGFSQWRDLLPYAKLQNGVLENPSAKRLLSAINDIKNNLESLNSVKKFESLALEAADFINKYTDVSSLKEEDKTVLKEVYKALDSVKEFSKIRPLAKKGEFTEELINILRACVINRVSAPSGGVMLADTMTLRAQDFKAVIIIGLNEGVFPSAPQEDPILKDNFRSDLQKLGHWLLLKGDRYSEERLLFYFALSCAMEKACLIYQRSDYNAKPKIPSVYITNEVLRLLGETLKDNNIIVQSRRPFEKYLQRPFKLLNKKEAALLCSVYCQDAKAVLAAVLRPQSEALLETKINNAKKLNSAPALTEFDGQLGFGSVLVGRLKAEGISPSRLRNIYSCPLQYLLDFITGADKNDKLERAALAPKTIGNIYHKILENFYKYILKNNLWEHLNAESTLDILKQASEAELAAENYKKYGMYPVVWDKFCKEIFISLSAFVEMDLTSLKESGFRPAFFEEKIKTTINIKGEPVLLRGTMDRVDISADAKNYQITDYKKSVVTKDVKKAIFKDGVLQPPLYFEMSKTSPLFEGKTPSSMQLLDIKENKPRPLAYDDYLAIKPKTDELLLMLIKIVNDGDFVLTPNTYCSYCPYEAGCRKQNKNTAVRNAVSKTAKKLKDYHAI